VATYTKERAAILRDFGIKVARLRAEHGSQEAFAHRDNVRLHRNAIGIMERGECEPGLLTLLILADAFEDDAFWTLLKSLAVPQQRRPRRLPRASVTTPAATSPARR
jgi:DNA-binding XRE family transcriptional regulator